MSERVPIVLCAGSPAIASVVINGLKPEYDVIHLILSTSAEVADIPALLRGEAPPNQNENPEEGEKIASNDYSKPPQAIVAGGGYDAAAVEEMRAACKGLKGVPWLRADVTKPAPPLGPEYGKMMVKRTKDCLNELVANGKMDVDEIVWF